MSEEQILRLERFENYMCRIKVRPEYEGRSVKPRVSVLNGMVMNMMCLWEYEEDEMYHGEYAMEPVEEGDKRKLQNVGLTSLATSDLEIIDEE